MWALWITKSSRHGPLTKHYLSLATLNCPLEILNEASYTIIEFEFKQAYYYSQIHTKYQNMATMNVDKTYSHLSGMLNLNTSAMKSTAKWNLTFGNNFLHNALASSNHECLSNKTALVVATSTRRKKFPHCSSESKTPNTNSWWFGVFTFWSINPHHWYYHTTWRNLSKKFRLQSTFTHLRRWHPSSHEPSRTSTSGGEENSLLPVLHWWKCNKKIIINWLKFAAQSKRGNH